MSERVRQPQDIRIVPAGAAAGSAPSPRSPSSSATAVQIFRLLASQAQGQPLSANAAAGDAAPADEPEAPASQGSDEGPTAIASAEPREPQPPAVAASDAHDQPKQDASRGVASSGLRSAAQREAQQPEPPEHDAALGKQIVHACATAAHGELFTRELADRIARFCAMSGASDDASWAVTLPMNPAVLPDTLLHLQLSPSSIGIRFETTSARSTQLISDNADALRVRLSDALGRHIDVELAA
jgi:Type III secretion protein (HpaP)